MLIVDVVVVVVIVVNTVVSIYTLVEWLLFPHFLKVCPPEKNKHDIRYDYFFKYVFQSICKLENEHN